jgi:hypothetical protein
MIIRIRTNVGIFRLDVANDTNLENLRTNIVESLRIQDARSNIIRLAVENENGRIISNSRDLNDVLREGIILCIIGKFEKVVVKKSFVDEDGSVVKEGTLLKWTDPVEGSEGNELVDDVAEEITKAAAVPETPPPLPNQPNHEPFAEFAEQDQYKDTEEDDHMRAPDESTQMQLIEPAERNLLDLVCSVTMMFLMFLTQH